MNAPPRRLQTDVGIELGAAPRTPATSRFKYLDGLRAAAALFVTVHHSYLLVYPDYPYSPPGLVGRLTAWMLFGHFAVPVFIVVSGYSLTIAVSRNGGLLPLGVRGFFTRRSRRILPPYFAALALSVVLILTVIGTKTGTFWDMVLPLSFKGVAVNAVLLQDLVSARPPNGVFWTIAIEWHIYFFFPVLLWAARRFGYWLTVTAAVLAGFSVAIAAFLTINSGKYLPLFFALFVIGMVTCDVTAGERHVALRRRVPWAGLGVALICSVIAVCFALGAPTATRNLVYLDIPVGLATACFLIAMWDSPKGAIRRALEWRPLVAVGIFSYSLYLVHMPLLQVVLQYGIRPAHWDPSLELLAMIGAGIPIVVAAAYLFFIVAERPWLSRAVRRAESTELREMRPEGAGTAGEP